MAVGDVKGLRRCETNLPVLFSARTDSHNRENFTQSGYNTATARGEKEWHHYKAPRSSIYKWTPYPTLALSVPFLIPFKKYTSDSLRASNASCRARGLPASVGGRLCELDISVSIHYHFKASGKFLQVLIMVATCFTAGAGSNNRPCDNHIRLTQ